MTKTAKEEGAVEETPRLKYEVLCETLKVGAVIAYRTAQVNLTKAQADALEAAQPGSVKFLGV